MPDIDTEKLTPRERLHHGVAILAGLLASGKYQRMSDRDPGIRGLTVGEMKEAEHAALRMVDGMAEKVGLGSV